MHLLRSKVVKYTTSQLSDYLDQGEEVNAITLDFSKAFDKVNHSKLVQKTHSIGINTQITRWIYRFLSDRTQKVAVVGFLSSKSLITSGIPQGSVIGPSLFLIYISTTYHQQLDLKWGLFADDTVVYTTAENHQQLQDDLRVLQGLGRHLEYGVKSEKVWAHHVQQEEGQPEQQLDYLLHNTNCNVPKVQEIKYLGPI